MKVSIGLPTYNRAALLRRQLESLLAQTFTDFEIIVSDNASTDDTEKVCREFMRRDERAKYWRYPETVNGWRNRNRTIEIAQGKYLMNACDDDTYEPEFLAKCVKVLDAEPSVAVCYTSARLLKNDGTVWNENYSGFEAMQDDPAERFLAIITGLDLCHAYMGVMRLDAVNRTNLFQYDLHASDVLFLAEMVLQGKIKCLDDVLFNRRLERQARTPLEWMAWQDAGIKPPLNGVLLTFSRLARKHADAVRLSNLPEESKEKILAQIPKIFMSRYGTFILEEYNNTIARMKKRNFSQRWNEETITDKNMLNHFGYQSCRRDFEEALIVFSEFIQEVKK